MALRHCFRASQLLPRLHLPRGVATQGKSTVDRVKETLEEIRVVVKGSLHAATAPSEPPTVEKVEEAPPLTTCDHRLEAAAIAGEKNYAGTQQAGTSMYGNAPQPTGPESTFVQHVLRDAVPAAPAHGAGGDATVP